MNYYVQVIRRLVILISTQATLLAQSEAYLRQAESASTAAKTLLAQRGESAQNDSNEAHDRQVLSICVSQYTAQQKLTYSLFFANTRSPI